MSVWPVFFSISATAVLSAAESPSVSSNPKRSRCSSTFSRYCLADCPGFRSASATSAASSSGDWIPSCRRDGARGGEGGGGGRRWRVRTRRDREREARDGREEKKPYEGGRRKRRDENRTDGRSRECRSRATARASGFDVASAHLVRGVVALPRELRDFLFRAAHGHLHARGRVHEPAEIALHAREHILHRIALPGSGFVRGDARRRERARDAGVDRRGGGPGEVPRDAKREHRACVRARVRRGRASIRPPR